MFFRQTRTGRNGREFRMIKLRTMIPNAEAGTGAVWTQPGDPRVTPFGWFLRETHIDEFPQLINVLLGQMSLVGPRPTSFEAGRYALEQTERLEVLPGITGLWQISGRSDLDFEVRTRLDIEYIERQSLRLDIEILLRTVLAVLRPRGAY